MEDREIQEIRLAFRKWIIDNKIPHSKLRNKQLSGLPFGYGLVSYILYGSGNVKEIKPRKMGEIIEFFGLEDDFTFTGEKWELI